MSSIGYGDSCADQALMFACTLFQILFLLPFAQTDCFHPYLLHDKAVTSLFP